VNDYRPDYAQFEKGDCLSMRYHNDCGQMLSITSGTVLGYEFRGQHEVHIREGRYLRMVPLDSILSIHKALRS
jgi:hypothetical protein